MNESEVGKGETETEPDRKVREFWAKKFSIYDIGSIDFKNDKNNELTYDPTAVLSKTPSNQTRKRSIYDISSLDFTT